MPNPNTPRRIAQAAFGLSMAASIEFNIIGTSLQTDSIAAMITNTAWSAFALLGTEIMCRGKYPARKRNRKINPWNLLRFGGVGAVALMSMILTFGHAHDVMIHWNAGSLNAIMAPLAVDGMMILSGLTLMVSPASRPRRKPAAKSVRKLRAA